MTPTKDQIEVRMSPDGFYVASSLEEVLERKRQVDARLNENENENITASITEFYNQCHDENGQFCEAHGSDVRHFGMEDWPKDRVKSVLDTVKKLQDKYGVPVTVNAKDSDQNIAIQVEALAAVDDAAPRTIDIHPSMKDQQWLEDNIPEEGTMVSGPDLENIVIHEYGHILELEFNATKGASERLALLEPFQKAQKSYDDMVFGKGTLEENQSKGKDFRALVKTVSPYAGEDMQEGIAEAFLQHELGIQNRYSDHVGMHFNNLIKG